MTSNCCNRFEILVLGQAKVTKKCKTREGMTVKQVNHQDMTIVLNGKFECLMQSLKMYLIVCTK